MYRMEEFWFIIAIVAVVGGILVCGSMNDDKHPSSSVCAQTTQGLRILKAYENDGSERTSAPFLTSYLLIVEYEGKKYMLYHGNAICPIP